MGQYVIVEINKEKYGIDIMSVQSIEHNQVIVSVPTSNKNIKGMINLRNEVLAVYDLHGLLGLEQDSDVNEEMMIIVNIDQDKVGFTVDYVTEILDIVDGNITSGIQINEIAEQKSIKGIANTENGLIALLDLEQLIGKKQLESIA